MNNTIKYILTIILIFFFIQPICSQEIDQLFEPQSQWEEIVDSHVMLAISTADYPVTPGDIYTLSFYTGGELVVNNILVESDYTLNFNIFEKINAENMTFTELKKAAEEKVSNYYSRSMPSLTIESVGMFRVLVKGEVPNSEYVTAWGLLHLSEVIQGNLYEFSSVRDISVISSNGTEKKYDLFKALILGEMEQDPYIKPGDTVVIHNVEKEVQVYGEVHRIGTYQLMNDENIDDLLHNFVRGFTKNADITNIMIQRITVDEPGTFYINMEKNEYQSIELMDGDIVTIPPKYGTNSVVYIEGAIDFETDVINEEFVYNRMSYVFVQGEKVSGAVAQVLNFISQDADLANSYIIRENQQEAIPVDLNKIIYNYNPEQDVVLEPFDRIQIPHKVLTVSVTGAVNNPGVYPYVPGKTYGFYIEQAGGIVIERNRKDKLTITDEQGNEKDPGNIIVSGDNINVHSNAFTYNFNRYFPIISTSLALVVTIITIVNLLQD